MKATSEFISQDGSRHVVSTASDGKPVEILVAPNTERPLVVQQPSDSTVRSNQFKLLPGPHRHTAGSNGAWSWRRSWKLGPDGRRVESFTSTGNVPKDRLPTNLQPSDSSPTTSEQTTAIHTAPQMTTPSVSKCRVLDAETDGTPAADNDPTCKLLYPGYPADNRCKCTFRVNGRDEKNCAVGFLYSCKPTAIEFSQ
ncbi:hypothetical protein M3Y97_00189900 [Aphelenchoides bicaudatus]|nr:hypothetical protein M3Y97_00189900 [Aphelenchoides bicaudatus]